MSKQGNSLCWSCFWATLALFAMFQISTAQADICFLPSMDCADPAAGTASDGTANDDNDDCPRDFNDSCHDDEEGWDCEECGGKCKCDCATGYEKKGANCVKVESSCSDENYKYDADKGGMWSCEECTDADSRNNGKYKCECNDVSNNGECVEDPCGATEYSYSEETAGQMEEKGYTCDKCETEYSEQYGQYDCYCDGTENDDGKCIGEECHNAGMYNDRGECEDANDSEAKKCTVDGDCFKIVCDSDKGYYDEKEACEKASVQGTQTTWLELFERAIAALNPVPAAYAAEQSSYIDPITGECVGANCAANLCPVDETRHCVSCRNNCTRGSGYQNYPCCSNGNLNQGCIGMVMSPDQDCVKCNKDNKDYRAPGCEGYPCCEEIDMGDLDCIDNCLTLFDRPANCPVASWQKTGIKSHCGNYCYACKTGNDPVDPDLTGTDNCEQDSSGCWVIKGKNGLGNDGCDDSYNITNTSGIMGNCSKCATADKAKCESGTFIQIPSGPKFCWHGCETMNYNNCEKTSTDTSFYTDDPSKCPDGAYETRTLFSEYIFSGYPMQNINCIHCESSNTCNYSKPIATVTCTVKSASTLSCSMTWQNGCCKSPAGVALKYGNTLVKNVGLTPTFEAPNTAINNCFWSDYASPTDGEIKTTTYTGGSCSLTMSKSECNSSSTPTTSCPYVQGLTCTKTTDCHGSYDDNDGSCSKRLTECMTTAQNKMSDCAHAAGSDSSAYAACQNSYAAAQSACNAERTTCLTCDTSTKLCYAKWKYPNFPSCSGSGTTDNCSNLVTYQTNCSSLGGNFKTSSTAVSEGHCVITYGWCGNNYYYCQKPNCTDNGGGSSDGDGNGQADTGQSYDWNSVSGAIWGPIDGTDSGVTAGTCSNQTKYMNVPGVAGTDNNGNCADVCCSSYAKRPNSLSDMSGCSRFGMSYKCHKSTTPMITCYRSTYGNLYSNESAAKSDTTYQGISCPGGWMRVPNKTSCSGLFVTYNCSVSGYTGSNLVIY